MEDNFYFFIFLPLILTAFSETSSRTFEFSSCKIEHQIDNISDNKLVQIKVNDSELNRRVKCFLKRKRDEINLYNIVDFRQQTTDPALLESIVGKDSCARTQSFLVKQQQSKGHLKGKDIYIYEIKTTFFKCHSKNLLIILL